MTRFAVWKSEKGCFGECVGGWKGVGGDRVCEMMGVGGGRRKEEGGGREGEGGREEEEDADS